MTDAGVPSIRLVDHTGDGDRDGLLTIKDVADAARLPQPVVAQLVPRTWVDGVGWMYTPGQLRYAVRLADNMRCDRQPRSRPHLKTVGGQE